MVGVGYRYECCQMQYRIATLHSLFHSVRVPNITCEDLELAFNVW